MPKAESGAADPVVIVVGGDALALSTAAELAGLPAHRIVVLWHADAEFGRSVEAAGAAYIGAPPDSDAGLERAGVGEAAAIIALSRDDRLNLHAALRARDANPAIRIVLRQFNRTLARKIEYNLANCSVLSLAWQSAATYAAAAVDHRSFRGLQFPEPDGPLTAFTTRSTEGCDVAGYTVEEAELKLAARIVAIDGDVGRDRRRPLQPEAQLTLFGEIARLPEAVPRQPPSEPRDRRAHRRLRWLWQRRQAWQPDPIALRVALAAIAVFALGTWYFRHAFGDWLTAIYFVVTTMTTTGYGDLHPDHSNPAEVAVATLLMLCGMGFSGIFIAFLAASLTRWQWVSMQGLRRVRRRGHIIVCGAGSIGTNVIDLLLGLGKSLVVVEAAPDSALVERARAQHFDLLTGDASRDATLDLCNLSGAHGLVALTNVDTLNLEIALGARARNPTLPIVLRIAEAGFAASIARHFDIATTFSAAALAAPAFAGLARFAGSRGRVAIGDQEFAIAEFGAGGPALPAHAIPLAVAREDGFAAASPGAVFAAEDRILALVGHAPRRAADAAPAAAEQVHGG